MFSIPLTTQKPIPNNLALHHRLLLWDCPSECDHTCQTLITSQRIATNQPVVQFYGKWPFTRILGAQEPLSVLFSAANLWAHVDGLRKIRATVPTTYTLRPFYVGLAYVGIASWTFSCIFHTRDMRLTEELDYLGAGANVLYGMYYTTVHHFRLDRGLSGMTGVIDKSGAAAAGAGAASAIHSSRNANPYPRRRSLLRLWTVFCAALYIAHVAYLKLWRWDYTYNMAANVACGLVQNVLWSWYSWSKYRESGRSWAMWPGFAVAWIILAMSLELFDFPPVWGGMVDAHCLWHLGTVGPTVLLYK